MKILIAEDDLTTRKILEAMLKKWGYEPISFSNGKDALDCLASRNAPRLALLDWMMPRMDGIEVCNLIREKKIEVQPYLIILTAQNEKENVVKGLLAGANDYLSKPYNMDELNARITVGRRVISMEDQLLNYGKNMEQLVRQKSEQLVHQNRLAVLGTLSAGIAHEINNPVTFISGNVQVLKQCWPLVETGLKKIDSEIDQERLCLIREEMPKAMDSIQNGVNRITSIVNGLKTYSRQDKFRTQPTQLNHRIKQAIELCHNRIKYKVEIHLNLSESLPLIIGDSQKIEQVLVNLIVNAVDAMEDNKQSHLSITTHQRSGQVQVIVEDSGPGFTEHALSRLFDPFFTTKTPDKGTGLGLSISEGIVNDHGGTIRAENRTDSQGARFMLQFPIMAPNTNDASITTQDIEKER